MIEKRIRSPLHRFMMLLAILCIMIPASVYAHARLLRSTPADGARLKSSPAAIRLVFSEEPMVVVTHVLLLSPSNDTLRFGGARKDPTSAHAVLADVPSHLGAGTYIVRWWTAASDGHPSSGSFTFTVLPSADVRSDTARAIPATRTPPASSSAATPDKEQIAKQRRAKRIANAIQFALGAPMWVTRWAGFTALFILVGAVAFKFLVLQRIPASAAGPSDVFHDIASTGAATSGMASAVVLVATTAIKLYGETVSMHEVPLRTMIASTSWGWAWTAQMLACIAAVIAFALAHRGRRSMWQLAAVCALILVASPALTGHAIGSDLAVFAVPIDTLHVLAGSAWLGTLTLIFLVGISSAVKASDGNSIGSKVATLVNAFSPLALVCGAMVVATGIATSLLHLQPLSRLWTSTYGMTLIVKLALVSLLFSLGAWNWRRVKPNLGGEEGVVALRFSAKLELAVSLMVLSVTAFLVALPLPD